MSKNIFYDDLGNELKVGDIVFFMAKKYQEFIVGRIIKFNSKGIRIFANTNSIGGCSVLFKDEQELNDFSNEVATKNLNETRPYTEFKTWEEYIAHRFKQYETIRYGQLIKITDLSQIKKDKYLTDIKVVTSDICNKVYKWE